MVDIIDVNKLYAQYEKDWRIWTAPLQTEAFWYSENYFKETMDAFDHASGGMRIILIMVPQILK